MSTLFKQLQSLAQQSGGRLMFSIVADKSGKLTVAAMPKSDQKDASESGLLTPLVLTGTPEELDLEFVRCLFGVHGATSVACRPTRPDQRRTQCGEGEGSR